MRYLLIATGLLAGCAASVSDEAQESCSAGLYSGLVGQDAAASLAVPEPKRVYVLGEPITMDFNPARINIELDDTDTIIALKCG